MIEHLLGRDEAVGGYTHPAATFAVATTQGMLESKAILDDPETYFTGRIGKHTVTDALIRMMSVFMIVDAAAAVACLIVSAAQLWMRI